MANLDNREKNAKDFLSYFLNIPADALSNNSFEISYQIFLKNFIEYIRIANKFRDTKYNPMKIISKYGFKLRFTFQRNQVTIGQIKSIINNECKFNEQIAQMKYYLLVKSKSKYFEQRKNKKFLEFNPYYRLFFYEEYHLSSLMKNLMKSNCFENETSKLYVPKLYTRYIHIHNIYRYTQYIYIQHLHIYIVCKEARSTKKVIRSIEQSRTPMIISESQPLRINIMYKKEGKDITKECEIKNEISIGSSDSADIITKSYNLEPIQFILKNSGGDMYLIPKSSKDDIFWKIPRQQIILLGENTKYSLGLHEIFTVTKCTITEKNTELQRKFQANLDNANNQYNYPFYSCPGEVMEKPKFDKEGLLEIRWLKGDHENETDIFPAHNNLEIVFGRATQINKVHRIFKNSEVSKEHCMIGYEHGIGWYLKEAAAGATNGLYIVIGGRDLGINKSILRIKGSFYNEYIETGSASFVVNYICRYILSLYMYIYRYRIKQKRNGDLNFQLHIYILTDH